MKLTEISSKSVSEIEAILEAEGISKKKLSEARETSFIPEGEVKFVAFDIAGEPEKKDANGNVTERSTRYVKLITDKGHVCSLSRLQGSLFVGSDVESGISEIKTGNNAGKYFLKNNTTPNTFLSGNQAQAMKTLIGKTFVCEHIKGLRSVYDENGYFSAEEVKTEPYTVFALTSK